VDLAATSEGHLEVAIHAPRLPFGSVSAESLTPIFQTDAVYGINTSEVNAFTGHLTGGVSSGQNTGTGNLFKCETGTTALSFATIQGRKRLRYRAGQGIVGRFAGFFTSPVASSILVAGFGTGESGFYFGYNGVGTGGVAKFGILHSTGGKREIRTLTVTTASTATNNYAVTLNDVSTAVAATNNASTVKTAYEISQGVYPGWSATQRGSTVVFLANDVGAKAGAFTLAQSGAGTPAAGTFATTLAGVAADDRWTYQADWNGDSLDGTGPSGYTIDPSKGNVYQIGMQYLGFGTVAFQVEVVTSGTNNADFVTVHTIRYPNTATTTSVTQPSFPFTMAAYSGGSTTNCSVSVGSFGGFVEGPVRLTGPRMTYSVSTSGFVGSTAGTYYPLLTVRNERTYAGRANQAVVRLISVSGSHDDATPVEFVLLRDATLAGTPNYTAFAATSCTYWDTAATTATISAASQAIFSMHTGQASGQAFAFGDDISLQPGETMTLAARAVTGTATYVSASLNTREDQ